ncbi:MAG: hypothetical protein ACR2JJ_01585 [Sphingomicrobium sp.]
MELLHKLWMTRDYTLPQFEPAPLEFDPDANAAGVQLIGAVQHSAPPLSPADDLRNALAELRRSLA